MERQGGRACNVTGRKRADRRDSPHHIKTMVSRDVELDLLDEAGRQEGEGEKILYPRLR